MTNLNEDQAEVVGDEISSEEDSRFNPEDTAFAMGTQLPSEDRQTSPSEMTITSSPTESPAEEATSETTGLLVQDRCGKPLECNSRWIEFCCVCPIIASIETAIALSKCVCSLFLSIYR